jgi:two-component system chemotaxis response regulator CheB
MGKVLKKLLAQQVTSINEIPKDLFLEAQLVERYMNTKDNTIALMDEIGDRTPISCPDCGGGLWKLKHGKLERYHCHVGHSFTAHSLQVENKEGIEASLWVALRKMEERKYMFTTTLEHYKKSGNHQWVDQAEQQIQELHKHIMHLRQVLTSLTDSRDKDSVNITGRTLVS